MLRAARHRAIAPLLLVAALLAAGCGGEADPPYRTLLRDLRAAAGPDTAPACTPGGGQTEPGAGAGAAEPRGVIRGHSRREAALTCEGVALRVDLQPPAPAVLDLSLTLAGEPAPGAAATAVLALARNGDGDDEPEVLREVRVEAGSWQEHRLELPRRLGRGGATLVLRSSGAAPVAWAGFHLSPADDLPPATRPSLILVSLDTVRADHLSLYGYERSTTPNLERLGADGLVFTRALSSSTWTLPSTATLLSGLLPAQHGTLHVSKSLGPEVVTVAERLRDAGYRTAALTDGGFAGFPFGFGQGFERYDVTPGKPWQPRAKDAAHTFGEAAAWIRRNRHRPFFLFLHTYEAHQPYRNREGFADPFLAPADRGDESLGVTVDPNRPEKTPEELARMVALYDGEIARADHYLGTFLDALADEGLSDEGLADQVAVIVTSDHGEEFLEHGDLEHAFGKVFDPNVHVPLVVKPPAGRGVAPRRIDQPVSGIDVAPTLLDLAGLPHDDLPGRSLLDESDDRPPVLVHGVPSFPNRTAERFRLDGAGPTAILDRPGAQAPARLFRYDPEADQAKPWPQAEVQDRAQTVPRLAALVAWTEAGSLFARLPDDARHLAIPHGSRIVPKALWSGRSWHRLRGRAARSLAPGGPGIALAPRAPHVVVFDLAPGKGPWENPWNLAVAEPGAADAPEPYRLTAERRPPWNPLADPLPPEGLVQPTAALQSAATATLDEATTKELKALGYLQ